MLISVFYVIRVLRTWLLGFVNGFDVSGRWPTSGSRSLPIDVCLRSLRAFSAFRTSSTVISVVCASGCDSSAVFRSWYVAAVVWWSLWCPRLQELARVLKCDVWSDHCGAREYKNLPECWGVADSFCRIMENFGHTFQRDLGVIWIQAFNYMVKRA